MRHASLLCPLILALAALPAAAQVRLGAQVSNLQWTLSDLAPGDGLAPALTLETSYFPSLQGASFAWRADNGGWPFHEQYLSNTEREDRLAVNFGNLVQAEGWIGGGAVMEDAAGGAALVLNDPQPGVGVYGRMSSSPGNFYFELGPMSSMRFSLDVQLALAAGTPAPRVWQEGFASASLYAGAQSWPDPYEPDQDGLQLIFGHQGDGTYLPGQERSHTLTVTLDNDDPTAWKYGAISFGAYVEGRLISPVPEPATLAMWLAGALPALALAQARSISWRTRRRQRSRPTEYQPK